MDDKFTQENTDFNIGNTGKPIGEVPSNEIDTNNIEEDISPAEEAWEKENQELQEESDKNGAEYQKEEDKRFETEEDFVLPTEENNHIPIQSEPEVQTPPTEIKSEENIQPEQEITEPEKPLIKYTRTTPLEINRTDTAELEKKADELFQSIKNDGIPPHIPDLTEKQKEEPIQPIYKPGSQEDQKDLYEDDEAAFVAPIQNTTDPDTQIGKGFTMTPSEPESTQNQEPISSNTTQDPKQTQNPNTQIGKGFTMTPSEPEPTQTEQEETGLQLIQAQKFAGELTDEEREEFLGSKKGLKGFIKSVQKSFKTSGGWKRVLKTAATSALGAGAIGLGTATIGAPVVAAVTSATMLGAGVLTIRAAHKQMREQGHRNLFSAFQDEEFRRGLLAGGVTKGVVGLIKMVSPQYGMLASVVGIGFEVAAVSEWEMYTDKEKRELAVSMLEGVSRKKYFEMYNNDYLVSNEQGETILGMKDLVRDLNARRTPSEEKEIAIKTAIAALRASNTEETNFLIKCENNDGTIEHNILDENFNIERINFKTISLENLKELSSKLEKNWNASSERQNITSETISQYTSLSAFSTENLLEGTKEVSLEGIRRQTATRAGIATANGLMATASGAFGLANVARNEIFTQKEVNQSGKVATTVVQEPVEEVSTPIMTEQVEVPNSENPFVVEVDQEGASLWTTTEQMIDQLNEAGANIDKRAVAVINMNLDENIGAAAQNELRTLGTGLVSAEFNAGGTVNTGDIFDISKSPLSMSILNEFNTGEPLENILNNLQTPQVSVVTETPTMSMPDFSTVTQATESIPQTELYNNDELLTILATALGYVGISDTLRREPNVEVNNENVIENISYPGLPAGDISTSNSTTNSSTNSDPSIIDATYTVAPENEPVQMPKKRVLPIIDADFEEEILTNIDQQILNGGANLQNPLQKEPEQTKQIDNKALIGKYNERLETLDTQEADGEDTIQRKLVNGKPLTEQQKRFFQSQFGTDEFTQEEIEKLVENANNSNKNNVHKTILENIVSLRNEIDNTQDNYLQDFVRKSTELEIRNPELFKNISKAEDLTTSQEDELIQEFVPDINAWNRNYGNLTTQYRQEAPSPERDEILALLFRINGILTQRNQQQTT